MITRVLLCAAGVIGVALWAVDRYQRRGGRINPLWGIGFLWVALSTLYLPGSVDNQPPRAWDLSCPLPGADSQYGASTWQSWPPGPVCRDAEGRVFSRPGFRDGAAIVIGAAGSVAFLTAGGLALGHTAGRRKRPRGADRAG